MSFFRNGGRCYFTAVSPSTIASELALSLPYHAARPWQQQPLVRPSHTLTGTAQRTGNPQHNGHPQLYPEQVICLPPTVDCTPFTAAATGTRKNKHYSTKNKT